MRSFIKNIGNSIHNPSFYNGVPKKSLKSVFGYFFLLILLLSVIYALSLIKTLAQETPKSLGIFAQNMVDCFPKDLELTVQNGVASASGQQPRIISCDDQGPLVVIDTQSPYSPQKLEEYKAEAWVTNNSIIYRHNDVETRTYELSKVENFKLNHEILSSFKSKVDPYFKFVGPILLLLAFLGIYLAYTLRLIHILFLGLLIWLLSKVFKKNLNYSSSFKVGVFAITLGLIVELVISLTSQWTNFKGFPFMSTVLTLAVVFVNIIQSDSKNKS